MTESASIAESLISQPMMAAAVVAVGAMAILKIVNEVIRLRETLRPKPEPQEVKDQAIAANTQVTERVVKVESTTQDLARRIASHDTDICALRTHERDCAARVHQRIDEIATVVHSTNGKVAEGMKHMTESLKEIRLIVLTKKEKS
jgi:hypothetical protein